MKALKYLFVAFMILGLTAMLALPAKAAGNGAFVLHNVPLFGSERNIAMAAADNYVAIVLIPTGVKPEFGTTLLRGTDVFKFEGGPPVLFNENYYITEGLIYEGTKAWKEGDGDIIPNEIEDYFYQDYPPSEPPPPYLTVYDDPSEEPHLWVLKGIQGEGILHIQLLFQGSGPPEVRVSSHGSFIGSDDDEEYKWLLNVVGPAEAGGGVRYPKFAQLKILPAID